MGHAPEWKPEILDASDPSARSDVHRLMHEPRVRVHDRLRDQLEELVSARHPSRKLDGPARDRLVREHLNGASEAEYGAWVHYPWSSALVHLLPRHELRAVRTDRNRLKILAEEQALLGRARIAIAGLSVGLSAAITLVLEGVGGRFALADFDQLGLSNLNRLAAPLADLGLNKAVLAARRLYELDPYLEIDVFDEGVTDDNLDAFLGQGVEGPSLLVEECDDLYMKIRLRERARELRMPVIMDTSDGGLLDVERFDLDPARPLLHGLVPGVAASALRGLATKDKVPIVLRILGVEHLAPRTAASLVEIGQSLSTWPQLASSVALGGALVTEAARRLLLGTLTTSGRYRVDLATLIGNHEPRGESEDLSQAPAGDAPAPPSRPLDHLPEMTMTAPTSGLDPDVRFLLEHARLAPSGGNVQPWRFSVEGRRILCAIDEPRSSSFINFEHRGSYVAMGCAVENMLLAAQARGLAIDLSLHGGATLQEPVCTLTIGSSCAPAPSPLFDQVGRRVTNRRHGRRHALHVSQRVAIERAASPATVLWFDAASELERLGTLHGRADRLRFLSQRMHREMMGELRWTREEAERTRDGLDVLSLDLTASDEAALHVFRNWASMSVLKQIGGGRALEESARKAFVSSSAVGVVQVDDRTARGYLEGGRALQRLWLAATGEGVAVHPQGALVYLLARYEDAPDTLSDDEREELADMAHDFRALVPQRGRANVLVLRFSLADPPSTRSLRRPLDEILALAGEPVRG